MGLGSAQATPPGRNGVIAFERYHYSDDPLWAEIWVVNPDGTGERRVSHAPRGLLDRAPDWSPDGSRIVFRRCSSDYDTCSIWSVGANGSGEKRLTPSCGRGARPGTASCPWDDSPAYSPDGRQIAFVRDADPKGSGLMVADSGLRHTRRVFSFGSRAGTPGIAGPAWSPDGKRLAFVVHNDNGRRFKPVNGLAVFVVHVDGAGLHRVTPWKLRAGGGPEGLDWSPDGSRILFRSQPSEIDSGGNIYTVLVNGRGLRQLTHFDESATDPGALRVGSYSPDGGSILFATYRGAYEAPPDNNLPDLFVMSADGTDMRPITRSKEWDGDPDWGPG